MSATSLRDRLFEMLKNRPITILIVYALLILPGFVLALIAGGDVTDNWLGGILVSLSTAWPYSLSFTYLVHPKTLTGGAASLDWRYFLETLHYGFPIIYLYHTGVFFLFLFVDRTVLRILKKAQLSMVIITLIDLPIFALVILLIGAISFVFFWAFIFVGLLPFGG